MRMPAGAGRLVLVMGIVGFEMLQALTDARLSPAMRATRLGVSVVALILLGALLVWWSRR